MIQRLCRIFKYQKTYLYANTIVVHLSMKIFCFLQVHVMGEVEFDTSKVTQLIQ